MYVCMCVELLWKSLTEKKKENELSREDQNNSNHTRPLLPLNMHLYSGTSQDSMQPAGMGADTQAVSSKSGPIYDPDSFSVK